MIICSETCSKIPRKYRNARDNRSGNAEGFSGMNARSKERSELVLQLAN